MEMEKEYTIQEIAARMELNKSTLYYYERVGLMLPVLRKPNGHRRYSEKDVEWLAFVKCMRQTGMPLESIRAFAVLHQQNGGLKQRIAILVEHHQRMLAQQEELAKAIDFIGKKIERFEEAIEQYPSLA
ncbi:MAG: MerR family transcriptional regulator [Chloroflexota bacterium]